MASSTRCFVTAACLSVAALFIACTERQPLPSGSERFDPPAQYQLWWSMTESCSGLRGSFADVDWSIVPGVASLPGDSRLGGEWFEVGNRIVLAGAERLDGRLVRHEMLHALLRANGHPRFAFLERCAGTVICVDDCIADAGAPPAPPAGTPIVDATSLQIGVEIQPVPARLASYNGAFALIVTAHNPADHAVIVRLQPYGAGNLGVSFQYLIGTDSKGELGTFDVAYDAEETYFRAGETKREAFDLQIGRNSEGNYPPGDYTARGVFGDNDTPAIPFTLQP